MSRGSLRPAEGVSVYDVPTSLIDARDPEEIDPAGQPPAGMDAMRSSARRKFSFDASCRGRMHIGLITTSNELIDRITKLVAETRGAITVASNPNRAQEMLQSHDYAVRIIDRRSAALPWTTGSCAECPIVNSLMSEDDLALVLEPGCYGSSGRTARYRHDDIERLVGDVGAILARHAAERSIEKELVGDTPTIQLVREMIQQIAPYGDISVMVLGETGTGKELVAKAIHRLSAPVAPFVAINCAAVPESLFESELFGHEAGAYTGARSGRPGLLEAAARGTMFLDEVGDMPMSLQGKLLRVLETRTFRRLGSNRDIPMEARIVCATNRNLETNLRPDLHYRLAGFTISIPPLRERLGDIGVLARTFLSQFTQRHDRGAKRLSDAAVETLRTHDWPGNARELRAVVERAAILSRGVVVESSDVVAALSRARRPRSSVPSPTPTDDSQGLAPLPNSKIPAYDEDSAPASPRLREVERDMIVRAYRESSGNLSVAARSLGIPRSTLRDKLRRYGVLS